MRVKVLLQITEDDGTAGAAAEVATFEKVTERPEDLGLSIAEAKALLAAVQQRTVDTQVACWMARHRCCEACGQRRRSKGSHRVAFLTLYGDVTVTSPRLHRCSCQNTQGPATVSPLSALIPDYVAPERLYLEARWASLVPYAAAADLLGDILPVAAGANATTLREHVLHVAERAEAELAEERPCFIDGCAADWARLPIPEGRFVVGLDGGGSIRILGVPTYQTCGRRQSRGCSDPPKLDTPGILMLPGQAARRRHHRRSEQRRWRARCPSPTI